jgi:hypothetical protein
MHSKFDNLLSDGSIEAVWETIIALATAAGICVSVISLAAHLDRTRMARSGEPSFSASVPTQGVTGLNGAPSTSNLN